MATSPFLSSPPLLYQFPEVNSSTCPRPQAINASMFDLIPSPSLNMSCFTMTLGVLSNLTALGILAKSHVRIRQRPKAPFLLLAGALLLADLGANVVPGAFALYLHLGPSRTHRATARATVCQLFGASLVFFGLCPLLLGSAMAVERYMGITQPLLHTALATVAHARLVVVLLFSLALFVAALPLLEVGTYAPQFPGTWCFLPIQDPNSTADTALALVFSGLGLAALILSLLCNTLSGLALLHARMSLKGFRQRSSGRRESSASSSLRSLDVEMMAQLALITLVSCVCWSPFLIYISISVSQYYLGSSLSAFQSERLLLLGLRMATWNQILDPWIYILLRRAVLRKFCGVFQLERSTTLHSSCSESRRQRSSLK